MSKATIRAYALPLLALLLLEVLVLPRLALSGAQPFLLPSAVCLIAQREGQAAGALWGLIYGLFAALLSEGTALIFLLSLLGATAGFFFRYLSGGGFWSAWLGTALAHFCLNLLRMAALALRFSGGFLALFPLALSELALSLLCFPLVYLLLPRRKAQGLELAL